MRAANLQFCACPTMNQLFGLIIIMPLFYVFRTFIRIIKKIFYIKIVAEFKSFNNKYTYKYNLNLPFSNIVLAALFVYQKLETADTGMS